MKKAPFYSVIIFFYFFCFISKNFAATLKGIEFIHNDDYGEILLRFDQENISIHKYHNKEEKQIILDIDNVSAANKVMRPFDTSEFSGALIFVSPYVLPNNPRNMRITLSLRDNVRSMLQKKGQIISLTLENRFGVFDQAQLDKNKKEELNLASGEKNIVRIPKSDQVIDILDNLILSGDKKYVGKKISFNVKDIAIDDLLKMIAETSGFNIILGNEVTSLPPLTLSLTNIPWDQALDTIFTLGKLVATKKGNILLVTTMANAVAIREEEEKSNKIEKKKEPLVTKIYPISFAKSDDITKLLTDYSTKNRGSISIDKRTNSLIIKDTMETIERMTKIIETLDTQTPLIQIEAKILEASDDFRQQIGLQNGISVGYDPVGVVAESVGPGIAFSSTSDLLDSQGGHTNNLLNLSVSVFKRLKGLDFKLQLMESQSKVKILSSPKVMTENNTKASLSSSESNSFQQVIANGTNVTTTWQQVEAQLKLEVTPKVTNEGSIAMEIDLTKGSFGAPPSVGAPPVITKREVKTNVLIDNGSTAVIGGVYSMTTKENHTGIPFIKDIPLIGWLFRSSYNPSKTKNELIIFITPRVVNQERAGLVNNGLEEEIAQSNKELDAV